MRAFLCVIFCVVSMALFSQDSAKHSYIDFNYFRGNIVLHNNDILGLITGHPEGVILSWNQKTFGNNAWEQRYNYPDYGASLIYKNLKNKILGTTIGVYAHYNFYFFKRKMQFRVGQGIAHTSNPYDRIENPKNVAFGSHLLSSTYLMLNYKQERIFDKFGLQAGVSLIHYSNANVKAPNTSINTVALNVGVTYNLADDTGEYISNLEKTPFTEPIRYNLAFRSGINQSDVVGSGQYPFYIVSAYADKRLSHTSAVQLGTDVFFSNFLKELIAFQGVADLNNVEGDEDYKRIGLFLGHELFINKLSVVTQLGYYVYYPFDFEGRVYTRVGLKRYFGRQWFGTISLKSHGAKAEAVEFGLGIRL